MPGSASDGVGEGLAKSGAMPDGVNPATRSRGSRSGKGVWVALGLVAGLLGFVFGAVTWLSVDVPTIVGTVDVVTIAGSQAAPGMFGAALLVLAASIALALARGRGRYIAASGLALAGVIAVVGALGVIVDPEAAASDAVEAKTQVLGGGLSGGTLHSSAWPWVSLVWATALIAIAVGIAVVGRRWPVRTEAARIDRPRDSDAVRSGQPSGGAVASPVGEDPGEVDPVAAWDALTRGEDPSAR